VEKRFVAKNVCVGATLAVALNNNVINMNKYNPNLHHRRSIRLKEYDYAQAGLYFITICCENRMCRFGNIENGEMILNEYGIIAYNEWQKLSERFKNFELDVFQIMPKMMITILLASPIILAMPIILAILGQRQALPLHCLIL
jgi:putative transposase